MRVLAGRIAIPTGALLLILAAGASDLVPWLGDKLTIENVQRITSIALVVILFEGGMHMGLRRFSPAAIPILSLGVLGTFASAALLAAAAHYLLGLSWIVGGLLGAALAPTDPAVTFSVLAGRDVEGRSGTILEGESGFNDPVGIALMIGLIEMATHDEPFSDLVAEFIREMSLGLLVGLVGGLALIQVMRRLPLPDRALYPLNVLIFVGVIYGVAAVLGGSGFLAVFLAGILVGDQQTPEKRAIESFHATLADLGEMAAFIALGVTVDLTFIATEGLWWRGLLLAVLLGLVIRPLVVGSLTLPVQLGWGERIFIMWSGLRGAVPILLASLAVVASTEYAAELYGIVFVVVLFSVAIQGTAVPRVARLLNVPMEDPYS